MNRIRKNEIKYNSSKILTCSYFIGCDVFNENKSNRNFDYEVGKNFFDSSEEKEEINNEINGLISILDECQLDNKPTIDLDTKEILEILNRRRPGCKKSIYQFIINEQKYQ